MKEQQSSPVRRVILFGIDGGGTFFEQANTPCIDRCFAKGAISRRTLTEQPTVSAECWGSMLHGVSCEQHRLTNWIASNTPFPTESPYPSVFRAIREARPEAKLASFCDWDAINIGIIENNLDVFAFHACDYALIEPAIRYIDENPDFTLIYFQFDSVDHNGHEYGYGSADHLAAITANDCYIAKIVEALEERGLMDGTMLMVEADHGGTPGENGHGGGHGGDTDAEKYVFFAAVGAGVNHAELQDMIVRDTSPAILHALGIAQPDSWTGRVPCGMFADLPGTYPRPHDDEPPSERCEHIPELGDFTRRFAAWLPLLFDPLESFDPARMHGKLYVVSGRVGDAVRFDDGALTLAAIDLTQGFSMCCWIWLESAAANATVVTNRTAGDAVGLSLCVDGDYYHLRVCTDDAANEVHCEFQRPRRSVGHWSFLCCVVDVAHAEIRFSLDFEPLQRWAFPRGIQLRLGCGAVRLGSDEESPALRLPAALDSFSVFRKALNDEELERLKGYYQA